MKILLISQYYWPENSRVTDIAESLQKEGNEVTVLTGLPNYPQGYIYEGYRKGENRIQEHNGVHIIRAKLIERRHDILHRLLNYYSFPYYATKLTKKIPGDFDVVLAMEESPIMLVKPAIAHAKKHKKPLIMYEMDLWPESLLAGGISNKSLIYKHYKEVSAKIYSKCDKILTSTKEHIPYIKNLPGCIDLDIEYLPQYADTIFEENNFGNEDNGVIDLMFAGNIGKAQSVDTIVKAAALLKNDVRFKFHIVGTGSELDNIKKLAAELKTDNVIFYGQRPLEDMPGLYKIADAMLVTLEDKPYANMTIPGKVQSYMAAGKPIIGAINGSCANFINNNNVGYICPSGDSVTLANLIKNLDLKELQVIGEHSKDVYSKKYSKSIFMKRLISTLESMKK
ncbi:MAG: glycosyltransferase family 4 protein [Bacilli bacterium]|nr:glycosyltransferase family 4 protein [Bacilli bacterium]